MSAGGAQDTSGKRQAFSARDLQLWAAALRQKGHYLAVKRSGGSSHEGWPAAGYIAGCVDLNAQQAVVVGQWATKPSTTGPLNTLWTRCGCFRCHSALDSKDREHPLSYLVGVSNYEKGAYI